MAFPLEGLRVLDLSRVLAGPFATRMLSDLGADVVKVEPPDGDVTRLWGRVAGENPGYYAQQNAGKRNICIDLRQPGGADLVVELAKHADVAVENFRPGVADRLGIGYAALSAHNPGLVMLSISGFGQGGPESGRAAFAPIIHAEAGLIDRHAKVWKTSPADITFSVADTNAGLHGLIGLLSALLMRERTGMGQHIDIAMIDTMLVTDDGLNFDLEDSWETKLLPSEVWDTCLGPVLLSADFRHLWRNLTSMFGVQDPAQPEDSLDAKFAARREAAQAYLRSFPDEASLVAIFDKMNMAWGRVRKSVDIRDQPTVRHRKTIIEVDDHAGGTRPIVQAPYRFSGAESGVRGAAPWKGEHNAQILADWLGIEGDTAERWHSVLVEG